MKELALGMALKEKNHYKPGGNGSQLAQSLQRVRHCTQSTYNRSNRLGTWEIQIPSVILVFRRESEVSILFTLKNKASETKDETATETQPAAF